MSSSSTLGAAASTFVRDRGARVRPDWKALAPALLLLAAWAPTPARLPASSADAARAAGVTARAPALTVRVGIETFLADVPRALRGKRVGLITNHTGIDRFANSGHRSDREAQGSEAGRPAGPRARHPGHGGGGREDRGRDRPQDGRPRLLPLQVRGSRPHAGDAEGRRRSGLRPPGGRGPHLDLRLHHGPLDAGRREKGDSVRRPGSP